MNIRDKIALIVEAMQVDNKPTFTYARKSEQNVIADNTVFPNILLIEPDSFGWTISQVTGALRPYHNLFVQFTTRMPEYNLNDEIARDANYRNQMIEDMKELASKFIHRILRDNDFEVPSSDIQAIPLIDYMDANLFGVEINIAKLISSFPLPC